MSLNGELNIMLHLDKQGEQFILKDVDIDLARPNIAQRMLIGQSPEQAIMRISQLMTVCQHAQTAAGKLALGYELTAQEIQNIEYENIEQGFWRLVIDLPKSLGAELSLDSFIGLRKAIAQQDHGNIIIFAKQLFLQICQLETQAFTSLTAEQFLHWLESTDSPMSSYLKQISQLVVNSNSEHFSMLTSFTHEALFEKVSRYLLTDYGYCQKPHVDNKSYETGSLSLIPSQSLAEVFTGMGVAGRFASRLLYIAQKTNALEDESTKVNVFGTYTPLIHQKTNSNVEESNVDNSSRLAWVQTARGLLIHLANIQQGEISQYSIIAPTEWNFHPEGALTKVLINSRYNSQQAARESARLAVLGLDPCIEFNLGVTYA